MLILLILLIIKSNKILDLFNNLNIMKIILNNLKLYLSILLIKNKILLLKEFINLIKNFKKKLIIFLLSLNKCETKKSFIF